MTVNLLRYFLNMTIKHPASLTWSRFSAHKIPLTLHKDVKKDIKIAKNTADQFVVVQPSEKEPFLRDIIKMIPE